MTRWTKIAGGAVGGAALMVALTTCASDPASVGNESISDPAVFEAKMRSDYLPLTAGIIDGLERLAVASGGGPADGVVIIPNATGYDAIISVDFDGNGSREGTIGGSIGGDIHTGAAATVAEITNDEPSLNGSGSLTVTETAPGMILLDNLAGTGGADPEGSRNAADVTVTDGSLSLDLVAAVLYGFIDMDITGEGRTLGVHVSFESDGAGGYRIRFTGNGFNFTIP